MWCMLQKLFVAGLFAALLGTPGSTRAAPDGPPLAPKPVFSRIHTVSIHVKDFQTFNRAFDLLSDDLNLPKKWGVKWAPSTEAKRMYAGFWAGNMCIEPCGPYETDKFEGNARAMFFAITFLPFESSQASAAEFEKRGLAHNGQKVFLSVTNPHLSSDNCGVCIMDTGRENREKDKAREAELKAQFVPAQANRLGLIGVEEIIVRFTGEQGRKSWERLLEPFKPNVENVWKFDKSPSIRLVKDSRTGLAGLVLKVRSLAAAKEFLKEKNMLGEVEGHQVWIAESKACGLAILLRE